MENKDTDEWLWIKVNLPHQISSRRRVLIKIPDQEYTLFHLLCMNNHSRWLI